MAPYKFRSLATPEGEVCSMLFFSFICDKQHGGELADCGGFSPFGALRHHLSPAVRGHNNPYYA